MEKTSLVLFIFFIVMAMPMVQGVVLGPKAVEKWFEKLPHAKQKVTKFHFYFHDIASGKKPTAIQIAQSNMTAKSPTFFGFVAMIDDPLTVGPEPNSALVGRAQGIYGAADQNEVGLLMTMNFVFTTGKYNGSTLSVLSRNPALKKYREMPIVGGSGIFRLAQGIATAKTYWINTTSGDAIVEYNVLVLHYDI
ncbi:dirigent protein 22-like [Lycium ferocissimum]|uniref:dirigent protein 22-like n=1 Tax=Lycium ferocissimum TaxID=112874 RepID=UPI0028168C38|nr:dirigent protein 22-like [Lycium ferocissimum]